MPHSTSKLRIPLYSSAQSLKSLLENPAPSQLENLSPHSFNAGCQALTCVISIPPLEVSNLVGLS